MKPEVWAIELPRRRLLRKRSNKRVVVQRKPLFVAMADAVTALGQALWGFGRRALRPVAVVSFVVGVVVGGRWALIHVLNSPRFAVSQVLVGPTHSVNPQEIILLTGVTTGQKLLSIDPDEVAARVATHPWVLSVRVERKLPASLQVDVVERKAAAVAMLGGMYLLDEQGHPFKRALTSEAVGLVIVTGLEREQYAANPSAARAAYQQALALLSLYQRETNRPALSEIRIEPRYGYSLYFLDSGAQVRLGRDSHSEKLARLDQILDALKHAGLDGPSVLRIVHLDTSVDGRVAVRLALGDS